MQFQKVEKSSYKTTTWAHGETTEFYIFPKESNYEQREFLWRVSSATVTSDTSEFTALFGVKRWIMPFDAPLFLTHTHNGKPLYSITLNPYESHCFKGDWATQSRGKARDFNLMLKEGAYGIVKPVKLISTGPKDLGHLFQEAFDERLPLAEHQLTLGFYSLENDFAIETLEDSFSCTGGEMMFIHYTMEEVDLVKEFVISTQKETVSHIVLFAITY